MKVFNKDGMIEDFALLLEVDDEQFKEVKARGNYYHNHEFMREVETTPGNHIVITYLNINKGMRLILERIKELLKEYDSVSWWDRGHNKFYTRRKK